MLAQSSWRMISSSTGGGSNPGWSSIIFLIRQTSLSTLNFYDFVLGLGLGLRWRLEIQLFKNSGKQNLSFVR